MAVNPAIVTLFSGKVLENLDKAHVFKQMTNSDYDGEIKGKGDALKIFSVGRPTVNNYVVGVDIVSERFRPVPQLLVIDQDKDWSVIEDNLERMLERVPTMLRLSKNAGYQFGDTADQFLANLMKANMAAANVLDPCTVGNGAFDKKAYDLLVDIAVQFGSQNVGETGTLHAAIPWWLYGMLEKDLRYSGYGTAANRDTARGAPLGEVQNMLIHRTNNIPTPASTVAAPALATLRTDTWVVVAAWEGATTYGEHIPPEGVEVIPHTVNAKSYDDTMRSRYVYGATVTHPEGIVTVNVQQGS